MTLARPFSVCCRYKRSVFTRAVRNISGTKAGCKRTDNTDIAGRRQASNSARLMNVTVVRTLHEAKSSPLVSRAAPLHCCRCCSPSRVNVPGSRRVDEAGNNIAAGAALSDGALADLPRPALLEQLRMSGRHETSCRASCCSDDAIGELPLRRGARPDGKAAAPAARHAYVVVGVAEQLDRRLALPAQRPANKRIVLSPLCRCCSR